MKQFLDDDFLLSTQTASRLYHDYAADMPIFDYHCHLPPVQIAQDHRFAGITEAWLAGDHYKWRAMRTNGVPEELVTGDGDPKEKFRAWARTVPATVGNPLYHWTHLELDRMLGIRGVLLNESTADEVYEAANAKLATPECSVRGLLAKAKVRLVCTTDDPVDSLEHHATLRRSELDTVVIPAFRPDKAIHIEQAQAFRDWLSVLEKRLGHTVRSYDSLLASLEERLRVFHEAGARVSDHALAQVPWRTADVSELESIFTRVREGGEASDQEAEVFQASVLRHLAALYRKNGWVMQLHIGALRNNSTRRFAALGPDTGFDSISDAPIAAALARLLDSMEGSAPLPKTIIYTLNPTANEAIASLIGCFQDGETPGKIQFGSGWWFNDQKDGMERQMTALANMGLLSRFVGMLTDSRSFLSFPRHEYFRRTLCNMVGTQVNAGELPDDFDLLGSVVRDICWNNAVRYFEIPEITQEIT